MMFFTKIWRFSMVGVFSTLLSLTMSVSLLKYFNTPLVPTYLFVYLSTLLLSYYLNSILTFKSSISLKKGSQYFMVYIFSMLIGTILYVLIPKWIILPNWYYPFLILPCTASLNYFLSNKYLTQNTN